MLHFQAWSAHSLHTELQRSALEETESEQWQR